MNDQARTAMTAADILKSRAVALARPPEEDRQAGERFEVIEFTLARERYAVQTSLVCEVLTLQDLTPVPCTPAWLAGVINLRGRIVAVLDLRQFFGLPDQGITDTHQVIVLSDHEIEAGLLADTVAGVREIAGEELSGGLPTLSGIRADYLRGVRGDGLIVLAADKILSSDRLTVNEQPPRP